VYCTNEAYRPKDGGEKVREVTNEMNFIRNRMSQSKKKETVPPPLTYTKSKVRPIVVYTQ
jgi:hypothetical protein